MGQVRRVLAGNPWYGHAMSAQLHHLALGAHDVDALAAFYEDILGLLRLQTHRFDDGGTRSVWLSLGGGAVLMLETVDEDRAPARSRPPGLFLLALAATDEERRNLVDMLGEENCEVTTYTTYFCDPEGNRVAVSSYDLPDSPVV